MQKIEGCDDRALVLDGIGSRRFAGGRFRTTCL